MGEPFVAATQYGDLKGTVSIDGWDGPFLLELASRARMPKGYRPIGLTCYVGDPNPARDGRFVHFSLAAVLVEDPASWGIDAIRKEAESRGELSLCRFDLDITPGDLLDLIKRLSIRVILKGFQGVEITEEES